VNPTLCLFRQDPAHMGLVRAVLTCLGVGIVMRIAPDLGEDVRSLAGNDLPDGFGPFYLLFTAMVAVFVLSSNAWTRSSRLALGLPLPARRVWAVRTGSLVAVALLSIGVLASVMGLSFDLEARRLTMNGVVALAAARASATVLLLICLFQLPQSGRDRIPIGPPYVVYLIGASLLTLVFSSAQITSMAGTLVLLAIAIALGVYLYRRVPPTFSIGPTIEESETPVWSMPDERDFELPEPVGDQSLVDSEEDPTFALHWILFRALKTNILSWALLGVLLASAWVATLEFFKGTNAFLPLFFLTIYQFPLLQAALESMAPFDPLPISRRMLWAHSVVPIIGSVAVGIGFALLTFVVNPRPYTQITYSECCVKAPWDYMELSRDGRVPTITASWGESYTPTAHPLWKGRTVALYDPFEVGAESSARFVEYQMHRAVEAVYDIQVPAALSYSDYESPEKIADGAQQGAFTLEETRGRMSADRNRTAAVGLSLLAVLITLLMLTSLLQYGSSVHRKAFKWISIGFVAFVVVIAVAVSIARVMGLTQVWYVGALISMGIRAAAHSLPFPTTILWFLCVTFWAGAYLVLERVFGTIEFPREKTMNRFAEVY
jgi:hypothetical protein